MSSVIIEKKDLLSMIYCAMLMSAIDHEIHEKEWAVVQTFVKKYWKASYGDFSVYKKEMVLKLKKTITQSSSLSSKLEVILTSLKEQLQPQQKNILLQLVSQVMSADNVIHDQEAELLALFFKYLGIQSE